jgi:hypothetical protein
MLELQICNGACPIHVEARKSHFKQLHSIMSAPDCMIACALVGQAK